MFLFLLIEMELRSRLDSETVLGDGFEADPSAASENTPQAQHTTRVFLAIDTAANGMQDCGFA